MATRSMRGRLTIFAFVLYVTLDLSNPFHPGAFNFNPEECVEAAHRQQQHAKVDAVSEAQWLRQHADTAQRVSVSAPMRLPRTQWRAPVPVAHAASPGSSSSSSPSSPTEDH
jgi:hypothetical protein